MKVNPSLFSVSAALIFLSFNATAYSAIHEEFSFEKDLCGSGKSVSHPMKLVEEELLDRVLSRFMKPLEEEPLDKVVSPLRKSVEDTEKVEEGEQWELVDLILKNAEISVYDAHTLGLAKAWKHVGGAGTLLPDAEGATLQKWQRRLKSAGEVGTRVFIPFMLLAPAGAGVSHIVKKYMTPLAVESIADAAFKRLSKISWAGYIPYKKALTKELVKVGGEKVTEEFGEPAEEYARIIGEYVMVELFHDKS